MGIVILNNKGLEEDILKYMKYYSKAYTERGCKLLTEKAKSCIEMFYNDYNPQYYDRTFDLKDNSVVPYFHNNGRKFYGGVRITSKFMSPYYSGSIMNNKYTKPIVVAQLAWHGWHGDPTGYNGHFEPIKTTPPLDVLIEYKNSSFFEFDTKKYAEMISKKKKYKTFKIE